MAFQAPTLLPWRTTLDNVLLPLEIVEPYRVDVQARPRASSPSARARCCRPSASTATRTSFRGSSPAACSSARRSAARSSTSRKMLLLDEPFGALDAFTREELWCVLRDLWAGAALHRDPGHARPARGGVPRRHRLRDEQAAGPHPRAARDRACRARATSKSPTPTRSPTSCTSCASASGWCARADGRCSVNRSARERQQRIERWAPWLLPARCSSSGRRSARCSTSRSSSSRAPIAIAQSLVEYAEPDRRPRVADVLDDDGRLRDRRRGRPGARHCCRQLALRLPRRCIRCWSRSTASPRPRSCRSSSCGSASARCRRS